MNATQKKLILIVEDEPQLAAVISEYLQQSDYDQFFLRGEIEALQDGLRDVTTERLDSLHMQVMNLNRLVNDLYELSMSDIGALNYQKGPIDGAALLVLSIDSLRDEFDSKEITVTSDWDGKSVVKVCNCSSLSTVDNR